jgi:hypothetical protein
MAPRRLRSSIFITTVIEHGTALTRLQRLRTLPFRMKN